MSYTKEELEQIKEEDYILWSELTSDPVTGLKNYSDLSCLILFIIGVISACCILGYSLYALNTLNTQYYVTTI